MGGPCLCPIDCTFQYQILDPPLDFAESYVMDWAPQNCLKS